MSGGRASRVFQISSGADVRISGLTITDGLAADGAGFVNQGTLTLDGCSVIKNQANADNTSVVFFLGYGGGLENVSGATMTIDDSTVSGNESVGDPTFGGNAQGGGIANAGVLTITRSTVSDTHGGFAGNGTIIGGDASGGGIYLINPLDGDPSTLNLVNSTLSDNQAIGGSPVGSQVFGGGAADGGGLFIEGGNTVTLTGSTIDGNQALGGTGGSFGDAFGGAIESLGCVFTIAHSTFANNQAIGGPDGTGITFSGSLADGGAIYSENDFLNILGEQQL